MNQTGEPVEGAFAILDVLGFRHRCETIPPAQLRDAIVGAVVSSGVITETLVNRDLRRAEGVQPQLLNWAYFSDTVMLWLPAGVRGAPGAVDSMTYVCELLLARAIWVNVPLRGAIAYGECAVSTDPIYYVGRPIVEAYEMERQQNWAGAVLCQSAESQLREDIRSVEWLVPLKRGDAICRAVDWPSASIGPRLGRDGPDWDKCFSSSDRDVLRKHEATKVFFEERQRTGRVGGVLFGPEQLEHPSDWRALYESSK